MMRHWRHKTLSSGKKKTGLFDTQRSKELQERRQGPFSIKHLGSASIASQEMRPRILAAAALMLALFCAVAGVVTTHPAQPNAAAAAMFSERGKVSFWNQCDGRRRDELRALTGHFACSWRRDSMLRRLHGMSWNWWRSGKPT